MVSTLDCMAAIGAVFRDSEGRWLCGIARSIDKLAARGRRLPFSATIFPVAPGDVRNLVEDDRVQSDSMRFTLVRVGATPFDSSGN
ncbi:hypothetical protein V6N13_141021 [Hibiscus sabdariffa]